MMPDSRSALACALLLGAVAGGAEAQTAWRAAHVEPFANLDCALCFHRADGRVLALATRPTVNGLETWELGRSGWYRRAPTQSPPARTAAALGYDAARRVIVLFGGLGSYGANLLDDTWEWDSVGWTNRTPANAPPARNSAAAAFDEPRGVFVVFGGMGALGTLGDQWQWNGIAWTQDPLAGGSPGPRLGALMAFDRGRDRLVLFGGAGSSGAYDNDIWEHDGATWSPVSATGRPPKLRSASITFDARRGRTVIYGGRSGGILSPSVVNTDVFEWDGSVWRAFASANGPGERLNAGFACDERTGELVLHGGAFTGGTFRCEPTTHTWSPSLPAAPERAAIGVAANDLAGRTLYHTPYGTHRWDHARQRWQALPAAVRPVVSDCGMAFDVARRQAVLFNSLGETWIWDEALATWQQRTPTLAPPPTRHGALAYDVARGRTVLFGGAVANQSTSQLWEWDGTNWVNRSPASGPVARVGASLAFDLASNTIVLFGGNVASSGVTFADDVWDWNGAVWTQRAIPATAPSPMPRAFSGLTSLATGLVLVGGQVSATIGAGMMSDESWSLVGNQWTALPAAVAWSRPPVAADPFTAEVVAFGGDVFDPLGTAAGVWILGDPRARVIPIGGGCAGNSGSAVPRLDAHGLPALGSATFALAATALPPGQLAAFALGVRAQRLDLTNGCRLFVDPLAIVPTIATANGAVELAVPVPANPLFAGLTIGAQCAGVDAAGGVAASGALELEFGR